MSENQTRAKTALFVGKTASAAKYDVLAALGSFAMAKDKHMQRLVLRLITLVTTRYNWRRDELSCGQDQIAQLWHVDVRTVKRDMAKLRAMGWLEVKSQAARGRVASYRLNFDAILRDTKPEWQAMGQDFEERLAGYQDAPKIVPLARQSRQEPAMPPALDGSLHTQLHHELAALAPKTYTAWFRQLQFTEEGDRVGVFAPSTFHLRYVETHYEDILKTALHATSNGITNARFVFLG